MHAYLHTHTHTHTHIHKDVQPWFVRAARANQYIHTYIHACMHTYTRGDVFHVRSASNDGNYIQTYIHTNIHTHIRAHEHMYTHTYTHTSHEHMYTHTYIHTYAHVQMRFVCAAQAKWIMDLLPKINTVDIQRLCGVKNLPVSIHNFLTHRLSCLECLTYASVVHVLLRYSVCVSVWMRV
jgi:hypothetical protein